MAAGILTHDEAQELLDCMWIKIAELSLFQDEVTAQYAAGYCITVQTSCGGIDQYGNDATNDVRLHGDPGHRGREVQGAEPLCDI